MLADSTLRSHLAAGTIAIHPFDPARVGSNSIDLTLAPTLAVYRDSVLDSARPNAIDFITIPPGGYLLKPGQLYLGVTREHAAADPSMVHWLDGKSSGGRLGLSVHVTAGRGDAGHAGHWTLEMHVLRTRPRSLWNWHNPWHREGVIVYPGMPIAQLTYFATNGVVEVPYGGKGTAKYQGGGYQEIPRPVASAMHKNFAGRAPR